MDADDFDEVVVSYDDANMALARIAWVRKVIHKLSINTTQPFPDLRDVKGNFEEEFKSTDIFNQRLVGKSYGNIATLDKRGIVGYMDTNRMANYVKLFCELNDDGECTDDDPYNINISAWFKGENERKTPDRRKPPSGQGAGRGGASGNVMMLIASMIENMRYFLGLKAYMDYLEANAPITLYEIAMSNEKRQEYNQIGKRLAEARAIDIAREKFEERGELHLFDEADRSQWESYIDFEPLDDEQILLKPLEGTNALPKWGIRDVNPDSDDLNMERITELTTEFATILGHVFITDYTPSPSDVNLYARVRYDMRLFLMRITDVALPYVSDDFWVCPDYGPGKRRHVILHKGDSTDPPDCPVCGKTMISSKIMEPGYANKFPTDEFLPFLLPNPVFIELDNLISTLCNSSFITEGRMIDEMMRPPLMQKIVQWVDDFTYLYKFIE